ncbi:hypothetical protein [Streptodolium elevatio]|uniref:LexA family protein n=1 Tax=Streptodolium elevatio TaxID=3157996 RepID=UPI003F4D12E3
MSSINERLKAAAQAIDELFADQAGSAERYQQFLAAVRVGKTTTAGNHSPTEPTEEPASSVATEELRALTPRQRKVLEVVQASVDQRGYPPSIREIGQAVGLSSTSSVAHQLMALERKGYLRRDPTRLRVYEVRTANSRVEVTESKAAGQPDAHDGPDPGGRRVWRGAQPGDEALRERLRDAWACVEKLREESDEQRRYLHRAPLTDADLAQHIGRSERTVTGWLQGRAFMPSRKDYLGIVEKLGGDPDEFDFIWFEGYGAYEVLKGIADEEPPVPHRSAQPSSSAVADR